MSLGEMKTKLKAKLAEHGMCQNDLIHMTGIPHTTMIRKLSHAPETLTLKDIKCIQQALNLTPSDIWEIFILPEEPAPTKAMKRSTPQ